MLKNDTKMNAKVTLDDVRKYMSRDFFLSHVSIALQKESDQYLVKRFYKEFPGLEAYLYLKEETEEGRIISAFFDNWSFYSTDIDEEEAWKCAEQNVQKDTVIDDLEHVVSQYFGEDVPEDEDFKLYVVTNSSCYRGASGVLDLDLLRKFARGHHCKKIMVIPSSIHEMLLLPHAERFDEDFISEVIKKVNAESVDPKEQLGDRPYILKF